MPYIDLHVHSNCSDGTFSPTELVTLAKKAGLCAFALTDHDTIKGIPKARKAGQAEGIEVIPGVEFSTEYKGKDIHIIGLDFAYENEAFLSRLVLFQDSRKLRNQKMIDKLRKEGGIDITWEKMEAAFGKSVWTRAHFGRFLLDQGYVKDISEAFSRYIGDNCPYFIPREKVTPVQAIQLIRETGGIPILAHPLEYHFTEQELTELVRMLKPEGLLGLEAYYSNHTAMEESAVLRLARKQGLAVSGGSDFHGSNKPAISIGTGHGNLKIPYTVWEHLKEVRKL